MFCTTQRGSWMSSGFPDAGVCVYMILGAGGLKNSPQKTLRKKEPFLTKERKSLEYGGRGKHSHWHIWHERLVWLYQSDTCHTFLGAKDAPVCPIKKMTTFASGRHGRKSRYTKFLAPKLLQHAQKNTHHQFPCRFQEPMSRAKYANMIAL